MKPSLKLKSPPLWWLVWSWEGGEFVAATLQEPDSLGKVRGQGTALCCRAWEQDLCMVCRRPVRVEAVGSAETSCFF